MKDEILRFLFLFFYFLKAHQCHLHNFPKNMATTSKFKGLKKPIVYWFQTLVAGQTFAFRLLQLATYDHLPQRKIVGDLGNYPSMVKLSFRLREGIKSEVKREVVDNSYLGTPLRPFYCLIRRSWRAYVFALTFLYRSIHQAIMVNFD